MNFQWVTIFVRDMEESLTFYQDFLGFELIKRISPISDTEIAFISLHKEKTQIELIHNKRNEHPEYGRDISLGFRVDSLDWYMNFFMEKKMGPIQGPFQPDSQIKFFYVNDPNGVRIQILELDE